MLEAFHLIWKRFISLAHNVSGIAVRWRLIAQMFHLKQKVYE